MVDSWCIVAFLPSVRRPVIVVLTLASDPLVGSVRQKQAIVSPLAHLGRYFFFCSSVPNNRIPLKPMD